MHPEDLEIKYQINFNKMLFFSQTLFLFHLQLLL